MASFRSLCDREGIDFNSYWGVESTAELYHFIGKDILYFHTLAETVWVPMHDSLRQPPPFPTEKQAAVPLACSMCL